MNKICYYLYRETLCSKTKELTLYAQHDESQEHRAEYESQVQKDYTLQVSIYVRFLEKEELFHRISDCLELGLGANVYKETFWSDVS